MSFPIIVSRRPRRTRSLSYILTSWAVGADFLACCAIKQPCVGEMEQKSSVLMTKSTIKSLVLSFGLNRRVKSSRTDAHQRHVTCGLWLKLK